MSERFNTEVLIVGTGISGLLAAIKLSERYSVTILSKSSLNNCSTAWAQGGIAAVIDGKDNINNHIKDTINKRNIVIEGFSFAPTESKRDYMFELNTIITTMKFAK